jgi:hypothetical protein
VVGSRKLLLAMLTAVGLATLFPSVADAKYDERSKELLADLKSQQVSEAERPILEEYVANVLSSRNQCMTNLYERIIKDSEPKNSYAGVWWDISEDCRDGLKKATEAANSRLGPSPGASTAKFIAETLLQEDRYLEGLQNLNFSVHRFAVLGFVTQLRDEKAQLTLKWALLNDQDNQLDEAEKAIVAEMNAAVQAEIEEQSRANTSLKEDFEGIVATASGLADPVAWLMGHPLPDPLSRALSDLFDLAEQKRFRNIGEARRYANYQVVVARETSGIFPVFLTTRRDTEEFLKIWNPQSADAKWQAGKDALDKFKNDLTTPGQRSDAEEFRNDVLHEMSTYLSMAKLSADEFLTEHLGRFTGPISAVTLSGIVEDQYWAGEWNRLKDVSLDSKIRDWRKLTETWWGADMSNMQPAALEILRGQIRVRVQELVQAMDEEERLGLKWVEELERAKDKGKDIK